MLPILLRGRTMVLLEPARLSIPKSHAYTISDILSFPASLTAETSEHAYDHITGVLARNLDNDQPYDDCSGVRIRTDAPHVSGFQEIVHLDESFGMTFFEWQVRDPIHSRITHEDWLTFTLHGNGPFTEVYADLGQLSRIRPSCIICADTAGHDLGQYWPPETVQSEVFMALKPQRLVAKFPALIADLPDDLRCVLLGRRKGFFLEQLPLNGALVRCMADLVGCNLRGELRRSFMESKAWEMITTALDLLLRTYDSEQDELPHSTHLRRLEQARRIIDGNLTDKITLAKLARTVGLNRSALAMGFKKAYGRTVQQYVNQQRMEHARQLLAEESRRVADVARLVGYQDASSFTRAFKQFHGFLPKQASRS